MIRWIVAVFEILDPIQRAMEHEFRTWQAASNPLQK